MAYSKIDQKLVRASAELSHEVAELTHETAALMQRMSEQLDDTIEMVLQLGRRVDKLEKGLPEANAGQETQKPS